MLARHVANMNVAKRRHSAIARHEAGMLGGDLYSLAENPAHCDVLDEDILDNSAAPSRGFHADARGYSVVVAILHQDISHAARHFAADGDAALPRSRADASDHDIFGRP